MEACGATSTKLDVFVGFGSVVVAIGYQQSRLHRQERTFRMRIVASSGMGPTTTMAMAVGALVMVFSPRGIDGFTVAPTFRSSSSILGASQRTNLQIGSPTTQLGLMLSPLDVASSLSLESMSSAVSASTLLATAATSQFLADAAAAAATTTSEQSWWDSYVSIFSWALKLVHSTINGPLQSIGIEQTWGIAIFLFTTSTSTGNLR
jgi:hypothetical protein